MSELTTGTKDFLKELIEDADNWSGVPLFGGNVDDSPKNKGHLTDLKKHNLVETSRDEGCTWIYFTEQGKDYCLNEWGYDHRANFD